MKKLFLPLLVITLVMFGGFAIYGEKAMDGKSNVLSETSDSGNLEQTQTRLTNDGEDDQNQIETQNQENDEEVETPEPVETSEPVDEEFESEIERTVNEGTVSSKIKIRSGDNKFEFEQEGEKTRVRTNFPLSVNPTTRELTVTTPAGSRVVAVLPEKAINNMIEAGFITTTEAANLTTDTGGKLIYQIDGTKEEKLLWLFKIALRRRISVSAETGEIVALDQSFLNRLLDFLSV